MFFGILFFDVEGRARAGDWFHNSVVYLIWRIEIFL